jgi:hypothetical protein
MAATENHDTARAFSRAQALFQGQQYAEAEELCRGILERDPAHAPTVHLLGSIARGMGFAGEGARLLAHACELEPANTAWLSELAQCQRQAGDHGAAIASADRLLQRDPGNAQAWADLGTLHTEAGDLDAAREALKEAVRLVPGFGDAWNSLARLKRFQPDDPTMETMARELARPGIAANERISFNYALGKAHEDLGDDEVAMDHYNAGAMAKRKLVDYDLDAYRKLIDSTIDAFRTVPEENGTDSAQPQPVFIVGMPRSGSTLVEQIIGRHGQVTSAGELTAFPQLVGQLDQLLVSRGGYPAGVAQMTGEERAQMATAYLEFLNRTAPGSPLATDKMLLNYLCCGLIAMVLPTARIVHCQRDPLDNCFSCYTTLFGTGQEYSYEPSELGRHYRWYRKLMQHWETLLGGRMLTIRYEQLVENPEPVVRELIGFLGVEWDPACLDSAASSRAVRTASMAQVRQPLYASSVGRGHRFAPYLQPLIDALESET